MWDPIVEELAGADWRVLAPDLPGFGASPVPAASQGEPSVDAMAQAVWAELDARDIDQVVVAGLSMGGYVAMAMIRQAPERIAALVLLDTKATGDSEEARSNRLQIEADVLAQGSNHQLLSPLVANLTSEVTKRTRPDVIALVDEWVLSNSPEGIAWAQRAMADRVDSRSALSEFPRPVLLIVGTDDIVSPMSDQQVMLDVLPRGEIMVIPGAGHLTAVESPQRVTNAMLRFLTQLRPPFENG